MPSNANVYIYYGPYKSNGIVDHKEDRLHGLKSIFKKYFIFFIAGYIFVWAMCSIKLVII